MSEIFKFWIFSYIYILFFKIKKKKKIMIVRGLCFGIIHMCIPIDTKLEFTLVLNGHSLRIALGCSLVRLR